MNKRFWIPLIIHITIVFLIVCKVASVFHEGYWESYMLPSLISLLIYLPFADLTYWFVFRKHSFFKGVIAAFLAVLFWAMLASIFMVVVQQSQWDSFFPLFKSYLGDFKTTLYLTGYIIVYSFSRKYIDRLFQLKEIQLQKTKNALDALKAQLNPHFFFNSLNYLYGTALSEKAVLTSKSIEILSDMMRYTLSGANENMVLLTEELKFVKNYIYLQKVRLPQKDSIQIETNIDDYEGDKKIAPMLLLPFIENAFKYGISIDHSCSISISIKISERDLKMEVTNSVKDDFESKGNNTGIANTRKRLDLLYNKNYVLNCEKTNLTYTATLSVKLDNK